MSYPPLLMRLRTRGRGIPSLDLWLPLFLLWPILFAVVLVLSPILLVGLAAAHFIFSIRLDLIAFLARLGDLICALRGLDVEVRQPGLEVDILIR